LGVESTTSIRVDDEKLSVMELALVDEKLANLTVGMPEKTQKEIMVWVK
jgi:hypothetical protein